MVDAWSSTPPTAQQFPHAPTDGVRQLLDVIERQKRELDEMRNNLLSTAGLRAAPGYISSTDFDGTSRSDLGTVGWMLGSNDGTAPYMVLQGRDIVAELDAKDVAILALISDLSDQQAALAALVNQQVDGRTATANSGGAIGVSAGNTYTTCSVVVPDGYSRAYVTGTAAVTISGGAGPLAQVAVNISGLLGYALPIYSGSDIFESGSPAYAVSLTGLTGGDTVTCGAYFAGATGVTSAYIITTLTAIFLR